MEPLSQEACGDGCGGAPGSYSSHGKFCRRFCKELEHRPGDAADLHPALQNGTLLLPEVIDAPPAFEVVKDGLDLPTVAVGDNDFAGRELGLGREIKACRRPSMMFFIVESAPYGEDRMAIEKSCLGDDRLQADFLPFPIEVQGNDLGGQRSDVFWGDLVSIDSGAPTLGGSRRWYPEQRGIFAHLADELTPAAQQGQEEAPPHEPGIGEEPDGDWDMGLKSPQQCPSDFQLVGVACSGYEAQTDGERDGIARWCTEGQRQRHPILCEDKGRTVALVAVVEANGRARGFGGVPQHQGIVDNQIDSKLRQRLQEPTDLRYCQYLSTQGPTFQELIVGGPVATERNAAEGTGYPAFGGNQATTEEFKKTAPRAGWHNRQKIGNPLRQAEGNETMKGHDGDSEKPKTLLIGRPFSPKGRPHTPVTMSSFSGGPVIKIPALSG